MKERSIFVGDLFIFLSTKSRINPVENNKNAAIIKSMMPQLTSAVNCIAINGINKIATTIKAIKRNRWLIIREFAD